MCRDDLADAHGTGPVQHLVPCESPRRQAVVEPGQPERRVQAKVIQDSKATLLQGHVDPDLKQDVFVVAEATGSKDLWPVLQRRIEPRPRVDEGRY